MPPSVSCSCRRDEAGGDPSHTGGACSTLARVSLLTDLDAFFNDHRLCGELDAGVDGPTVWFDCECGARIARRADDGAVLDVDA